MSPRLTIPTRCALSTNRIRLRFLRPIYAAASKIGSCGVTVIGLARPQRAPLSMHRPLTVPCVRLVTRPSSVVTNLHESCGQGLSPPALTQTCIYIIEEGAGTKLGWVTDSENDNIGGVANARSARDRYLVHVKATWVHQLCASREKRRVLPG